MPNYTTNYNLEKPLQEEFYNVDVQNANMDKIDTVLNENAEAANDHITNKNNPHNVTKNQIGLGNVNNTSDANKPVSTAQATAIADAKKAATDHIANKNNPHDVTASQVGAAPTAHASSATTYGIGTSSNYGHVKLSDSVSSTSAASAGVAASPKAVKSAYDLANAALPKAGGNVTGEIHVEMNSPAFQLNDLDSGGKTRILKNAGSDSDYGTYITDFAGDGTRDTLILNRSANDEQKLQLRIQQNDGTDETYEIYGEHHPEVNTLYSKSSVSLARTVDTSFLGLLGGNNASAGAVLELCGKNHSSLPGYFRLHSKDGTNSVYLEGRPDGTLTWDGKTIGDGGAYKLPYATCSTAKATDAKVATITNSVSFSLEAGTTVTIKFTNGLGTTTSNSSYNFNMSTLNVNSTGAKTVKFRYVKGTQDVSPFHNNNTYQFVYDGTYWNEVSGLTQKYNTASGN